MSDFVQVEILVDMSEVNFLLKCVEMAEAASGVRDSIFEARCAEMKEKLAATAERIAEESR